LFRGAAGTCNRCPHLAQFDFFPALRSSTVYVVLHFGQAK
jgi:hypothetical protein